MKMTFAEFDRIVADRDVQDGQPCIKGTRMTVRRILDILSTNPSWTDLQLDYPELTADDIRQVLGFAAAHLSDRITPVPAAP